MFPLSGFDINAQDSMGKMPLHIACQHGIGDNVVALLNFATKVGEDEPSCSPDSLGSEQGEATSLKMGPCCPRPGSRVSKTQSRDSVRSQGLRESSLHSLHSLQSQGSSPSYDRTPSPGEGPGGLFYMHPIGRWLVSLLK